MIVVKTRYTTQTMFLGFVLTSELGLASAKRELVMSRWLRRSGG